MNSLKERIRREGRILPGHIVKVDGFLNHRVDVAFMEELADEFGIALATICAQKFGVPLLFAKKAKSDNIEGGLYQSDIFSYTYNKKVTLLVAKDWIHSSDRVLIIDDFMARGEAMRGLCEIVEHAGATLEKGFQGGGDALRAAGYPLHSLAVIDSAENGKIVFRGGDD